MAITFDAANKRIILGSAYVDAQDLYSRWKDWTKTGDNAKYLPAFRVTGGDPLPDSRFVASYFFLLNGWRVRPMESNHTLKIVGNLLVEEGGDPVVNTLGSFNVLTQYTVPVQAQGIATSGGTSADPTAIAAAVAALLSTQMAKIDQLTFTMPGVVDANVKAAADHALKSWNGTEWV